MELLENDGFCSKTGLLGLCGQDLFELDVKKKRCAGGNPCSSVSTAAGLWWGPIGHQIVSTCMERKF